MPRGTRVAGAGTSSIKQDMQPTPASPSLAPLILTLALDAQSQTDFDHQRRRYYPAHLNQIPAHISLFHALPGDELPSIRQQLLELTAATPPFPVNVHDIQKLGRGVAYSLQSPPLTTLHAHLRQAWLPWLTPQDAQGFRPHVVIQNKADPSAASALYARLAASFRPWSITATGLLLWHYLGGPWQLEQAFTFPADNAT
jgi:2'-5' RNA ligase